MKCFRLFQAVEKYANAKTVWPNSANRRPACHNAVCDAVIVLN